MKRGYTLIELVIVIGITGMLVTFGISSYSKAQQSQKIKTATEVILSTLSESQKQASSGDKDCDGIFLGEQLSFDIGTGNMHTQAMCAGGVSGAVNTIIASGVTFTFAQSLLFQPLNLGVKVDSGDPGSPDDITYTTGGSTYIIEVSTSGTITNKGKQ